MIAGYRGHENFIGSFLRYGNPLL